jgi:hypothetical protein
MPTARPQIEMPSPNNRTRTGLGRDILPGVDARTWAGRRYREVAADLVSHLGGEVTVPQEALIRRIAQLTIWAEQQEAAFANDPSTFDVAAYTTAINALRRMLVDLGLERRQHDVTPSLDVYLAAKAREAASDGEAA